LTNVVVYINYPRRKVDSGYDHALIRTIRGVGYQISAKPSHVRAHLTALSRKRKLALCFRGTPACAGYFEVV
jgi:hypothetical protein